MIERADSKESGPVIEAAAQTFAQYLAMREDPEKADAIFVLGGNSEAPPEKAAALYKQGFAPKIFAAGIGGTFGGDRIWGKPEHEKYVEILMANGVPRDAMITEGLARNTLQEVQEAFPLMRRHSIEPRTVILVSRPLHQRRAWATFRRQEPHVRYINCPADEPLDIADNDTRVRLVQEAERLLDYAAKDDVERQEIPREVLKAAATVRRALRKGGHYTTRIKSR